MLSFCFIRVLFKQYISVITVLLPVLPHYIKHGNKVALSYSTTGFCPTKYRWVILCLCAFMPTLQLELGSCVRWRTICFI